VQAAEGLIDDSSALVSLGIALRKNRQFEQALELFNRALELDSGNHEAYHCRASIHWDQGQYSDAVADYTKALELNPRHAWSWCDRGKIRMRHFQHYEAALADFDMAIQLNPSAHFYKTRAQAHFRLQQFDDALADLTAALESNPPDLSAVSWISGEQVAASADLEFREGMRRLADRGVELSDRVPEALIRRSRLLLCLGDWQQAQKDLEAIVAIYQERAPEEPDHAQKPRLLVRSLNNLAWFLATQPEGEGRDPQRAVKLATRATELEPKNAGYWSTLGVAHYRAGNWQPALESFEKSMQRADGGNSFDWFFTAMTYWQLERRDDAKQWYAEAIAWMNENKPDNQELIRFRAEAAHLLEIADEHD
jgi:tetratricopeptide (TPR) repeat protein